MQKFITGSIIGMVIGILFGASVVAPRLTDATLHRSDDDGNAVVAEQIEQTPVPMITSEPVISNRMATEVQWDMVSAFPASLPILGALPQRLGQEIASISNGTISIIFHEPGTLAPAGELFDAVRSSAIDAAFTAPAFAVEQVPALGLYGAVPFGPSPREMLSWLYVGDGLEQMDAIYHERDLHAVPCGMVTAEAAGWFRSEITDVGDLNGLRMRIGGLAARAAQKLGIETLSMDTTEVYGALKAGVIDAAESSLPSVDRAMELQTAAGHYYFPGWHQRSTLLALIVRLERWQNLSTSQQHQILAVCGDNVRASLAEGEARQFEALKEISAAGTKFGRLPVDVLNALSNAWDSVVETESENDAEFRKVWASLVEFRRDYDIWDELSSL